MDIGDFHTAIETECTTKNIINLKKYLRVFPEIVSYDEGYFFELIVGTGDLDLIKLFIEHGADIFLNNHKPLYICSLNKLYDCMDYLLEMGEDVENLKDVYSYDRAIEYLKSKK